MFTRHGTISRTKHQLNTLPEESSYQKTDKEEHDENITTIRTNLLKRFSAPKLRDNSKSKDDNTNRIRRYNSGSQINQNGHHKKKSLDKTHESFDIRMTYDYYQRNLRKDDVFYRFSSNVDRYGFVESEENKPRVMSTQMTKQERKLEKKDAERSLKWAHWVAQSKYVIHSGRFGSSLFVFPSGSKFVDRVCKGIPDSWRNPVWYSLVTKSGGETDERLIAIYMSLLKLSSTHERQIDLDIPRTLHKHIMFRTRYGPGQRALFNVLRAFSNYDKKVGYCQGMTNLVTILLMYYSEEYAFIMLIRLFERCNLHNLYIPGFPALMESFYIQERLMGMYTPKISKHLDKLQIQSTAYATKWYITLFASDTVPHHTVLRIWDLLMLHGFDVLYFVAVALLKYNKSNLLASDFDNALTTLSSFMDVVDDDKLIKRIVKMFDKKGRKVLIGALKDEYKRQSNH